LGEQPACRCADRAQAGLARDGVAARGHVGSDVLELVDHPPGPLHHGQPIVGEPAPVTVDQCDAEFFLESGDVAAHIRLDRVEGPRSCGERTVIGDRNEGGELPEVHLEK
jgi:hypothetical protein